MDFLLTLIIVFFARLFDVILQTTVTLSMVSNKKIKAGIIGFVEAMIFVLVFGKVLDKLDNPLTLITYGAAYGLGIMLAMYIEEKYTEQKFTAQIVIDGKDIEIIKDIRNMDIPVTVIDGQGINNQKRLLLYIVLNKKKYHQLNSYVKDKGLFMNVSKSSPINGYFR